MKSNFITYVCMVTFESGETMNGVRVTMPNKAYWAGQLERELQKKLNKGLGLKQKITKVKVFRNSEEGGILIRNNRLIYV